MEHLPEILIRGLMMLAGIAMAVHYHCMSNFSDETHGHTSKILMSACTGLGMLIFICGLQNLLTMGLYASVFATASTVALSVSLWRDGVQVSGRRSSNDQNS
jgi:formate/nitrite transporter FocA (FNT family)